MQIKEKLNQQFTTQVKLFFPTFFGYVLGCIIGSILYVTFTHFFESFSEKSPLFFVFIFGSLIFGIPGYLASLFIFYKAKQEKYKISYILFWIIAFCIATASIPTILVTHKESLNNIITYTSVYTGIYVFYGLVCTLCMLFFFSFLEKFSWFKNKPDNSIDTTTYL